jgi:ADP-heptose:LPS heptosyltransferase
MSGQPQAVLVVRTDVLGDAVVSANFISDLAQAGYQVDVLCHSQNYPAFAYHPAIDQIYQVKHQQGSKQLAADYREVTQQIRQAKTYLAVFVLNGCYRTYRYAARVGARWFIARKLYSKSFQANMWMKIKSLTSRYTFIAEDTNQHEVIRLQAFLKYILKKLHNAWLPELAPSFRFYLPPMAATFQVPNSVAINISGKKPQQRYLNDALVFAMLTQLPDWVSRLAIVYTPDDSERLNTILSKIPGLTKKLELISSPDLFVVATQLANYQYFIGADGGLVHLAAGLGLACVTLFDKQDCRIWHPWTPCQIALQTDSRDIYDISYLQVLASLNQLKEQGCSI